MRAEDLQISLFLDLVTEMFERSDYLLPLAAGQRQFREDNYQMASAAQLEDLFYDALGMYLRENHPQHQLDRRTGSELWDYRFNGLELSHKEALSRGVSVWWTAGDRTPEGSWVPAPGKETYSSPHPIVLVYSGRATVSFEAEAISPEDGALLAASTGGALLGSLGSLIVSNRSSMADRRPRVLATWESSARLHVERVWTSEQWAELSFFEAWRTLGGEGLATRDVWVEQRTGTGQLSPGQRVDLDASVVLPGVYVLSQDQLTDAPMVANNRAHSIDQGFIDAALRESAAEGRFRPFPLWFASFADAPPPDLYVRQREQYERLFAARRRAD